MLGGLTLVVDNPLEKAGRRGYFGAISKLIEAHLKAIFASLKMQIFCSTCGGNTVMILVGSPVATLPYMFHLIGIHGHILSPSLSSISTPS